MELVSNIKSREKSTGIPSNRRLTLSNFNKARDHINRSSLEKPEKNILQVDLEEVINEAYYVPSYQIHTQNYSPTVMNKKALKEANSHIM